MNRALIAAYGLSQVKMLGYVPNGQLRQLLATSAAFILPSQVYEGFPMTVTEAYAADTPVLGSAHGNVGSLVCRCGGMTFRHDDAREKSFLFETVSRSSGYKKTVRRRSENGI